MYSTTGRKYALIKKYALNKHVHLLARLYSIMQMQRAGICSNISLDFYFLPGSGDPVTKQDRPLFGTGVYKLRPVLFGNVFLVTRLHAI